MSEPFVRALSHASSAQVVKNSGFSRASSTTVDTVSDLLAKYVSHLCATTREVRRLSIPSHSKSPEVGLLTSSSLSLPSLPM